eukprot:8498033-Lingulodinium_polyedra.AAC.1
MPYLKVREDKLEQEKGFLLTRPPHEFLNPMVKRVGKRKAQSMDTEPAQAVVLPSLGVAGFVEKKKKEQKEQGNTSTSRQS